MFSCDYQGHNEEVNLCVSSPGAKYKLQCQCHPQAFFFFERENYPSFKYSQLGIKMDGPAWDSPVCDINWALRHMKEEKR